MPRLRLSQSKFIAIVRQTCCLCIFQGELHHAQEVLETAWRSQQLTGAGNRSVAASYVRHFYPELTDIQALDQPRSNAAGLQMKIVIDGTAVNWPPVTVITPTCYDRQSRHANLLQMWQHQVGKFYDLVVQVPLIDGMSAKLGLSGTTGIAGVGWPLLQDGSSLRSKQCRQV
eukprot:SAG31_NODE_181_length_21114_cov_99.705211_8_plen_172_part_00